MKVLIHITVYIIYIMWYNIQLKVSLGASSCSPDASKQKMLTQLWKISLAHCALQIVLFIVNCQIKNAEVCCQVHYLLK